MTSGAIADSIINLCGAIGLAVAMMAFHRRDPRGPLTTRLLVPARRRRRAVPRSAALRGGAIALSLDWLSAVPAALVPLGALLVTEGILRRHAPRLRQAYRRLRRAAAWPWRRAGAGVLCGALCDRAVAVPIGGIYGLRAVAGDSRDRGKLLASENRSIGRVRHRRVAAHPLHRHRFPGAHARHAGRLGALGALLVVTAILIAGQQRRDAATSHFAWRCCGFAAAALLGMAAAFLAPDVDAAQIARFCGGRRCGRADHRPDDRYPARLFRSCRHRAF